MSKRIDDETPSVLDRIERCELVVLWGKEPNLTEGERRRVAMLERRMISGSVEKEDAR
tara:strand:+ start:356 stop:529 length:174 start_codon:yes stop_codon:yes gene_type:complete